MAAAAILDFQVMRMWLFQRVDSVAFVFCIPNWVKYTQWLLRSTHLQYGARDKFLSGVVGGRPGSASVAIVASADGESLAEAKRIVTDVPQELELSAASPPLGRCH